jgi:glycosyltransferase involved in cell wall biosynthesis
MTADSGQVGQVENLPPPQQRPAGSQPAVYRLPDDVRYGTFVVIPAYNEAACIEEIVREVRAQYPNVVVVDDGSSDHTFEAARCVAPYILRHAINRGQGAALQTGIEFALARGAEFVVTFDADGQHCTEDIQAMVAPISRGECQITLGSRFLGGTDNIPSERRRTLRAAVLFTRVVNRVNVTDAHNGLRAFSRRAARKINITLDRMAHASELIDQIRWSGLPFKEIPVRIRYTDYSLKKGQSSRNAIGIVVQYVLGRILQ